MKLRIHLFEWPSRHNVHLALPIMLVLSFLLHAASLFHLSGDFSAFGGQSRAVRDGLLPLAGLSGSGKDRADAGRFGSGIVFFRKDFRARRMEAPADRLRCELRRRRARSRAPAGSASVAISPALIPERRPVAVAAFVPKPVAASGAGGSDHACGSAGHWKDAPGLLRRTLTFLHVTALPRQGLAPAEFLVAVSPDGLPMHFFPQRSSGNEDLDRAALRYLAGCRLRGGPLRARAGLGNGHLRLGSRRQAGRASNDPRQSCRTGLIYTCWFFLPPFWPFG